MIQCGDSLVFGGAHGFVGIGVGVPHRDEEGQDGNGVAVLCVFPPAFSPDSSPMHGYQGQNGSYDLTESKEPHPSSPSPDSNPLCSTYDTSVLRLRGHGYTSNITCLAASPSSPDIDPGELCGDIRIVSSVTLLSLPSSYLSIYN